MKKPRLVPLSLSFVLFACAAPQKNEAPVERPEVTVERILPRAESLDASAIEVTLKLVNPAGAPITLDRIDYEVDTHDVGGVLRGSTPSSASLESLQTAEVSFTQSIPFPEELEAYKAVIGRGSIPLHLKGVVVLGDGTQLPFERRGEVATPTLPAFVVHEAQAARYEREGLDVTLFLRLVNENVFPVTIERVRYTVYVEDKKIKSEQAAVGLRLIQGGAEEYEVSTVLDENALEKGRVKQILDAGRVTYKVSGRIALPRLEIPFEHTGEINLATNE